MAGSSNQKMKFQVYVRSYFIVLIFAFFLFSILVIILSLP